MAPPAFPIERSSDEEPRWFEGVRHWRPRMYPGGRDHAGPGLANHRLPLPSGRLTSISGSMSRPIAQPSQDSNFIAESQVLRPSGRKTSESSVPRRLASSTRQTSQLRPTPVRSSRMWPPTISPALYRADDGLNGTPPLDRFGFESPRTLLVHLSPFGTVARKRLRQN